MAASSFVRRRRRRPPAPTGGGSWCVRRRTVMGTRVRERRASMLPRRCSSQRVAPIFEAEFGFELLHALPSPQLAHTGAARTHTRHAAPRHGAHTQRESGERLRPRARPSQRERERERERARSRGGQRGVSRVITAAMAGGGRRARPRFYAEHLTGGCRRRLGRPRAASSTAHDDGRWRGLGASLAAVAEGAGCAARVAAEQVRPEGHGTADNAGRSTTCDSSSTRCSGAARKSCTTTQTSPCSAPPTSTTSAVARAASSAATWRCSRGTTRHPSGRRELQA